jgi:hypothetical protein
VGSQEVEDGVRLGVLGADGVTRHAGAVVVVAGGDNLVSAADDNGRMARGDVAQLGQIVQLVKQHGVHFQDSARY